MTFQPTFSLALRYNTTSAFRDFFSERKHWLSFSSQVFWRISLLKWAEQHIFWGWFRRDAGISVVNVLQAALVAPCVEGLKGWWGQPVIDNTKNGSDSKWLAPPTKWITFSANPFEHAILCVFFGQPQTAMAMTATVMVHFGMPWWDMDP